ncbi:transcriptional regulator, partial [Bacteroides sp. KG68]
VCQVLDFNFFALFCSMSHKISAYLAAVTLNGNANNNIGDGELAAQLSKEQATTDSLKATISLLKEHIDSLNTQINRLDSNLKDKDVIIELLKERRQ